MNDWIEWNGGDCPVPPETMVQVKLRCAITHSGQPAEDFYWSHTGGPGDIVAYRVISEPDNYAALRDVLDRAYNQAATGKGNERHAQGQAFEDQPMQTISRLLGTQSGMLFQAIKKIQESQRLPPDRAVHELLGAINYIAGAVIYYDHHDVQS